MESKEEQLISVRQERSYVGNFKLGMKVSFKSMGLLMRYLWPSIVLSILVPVFGWIFYAGQTDALLRKLIELGYVPDVRINSLKGEVVNSTKRYLLNFAILLIFFLVIVGIMVVPVLMGVSKWWGVAGVALYALMAFPMDAVCMEVSFSSKPLAGCFRSALLGYRNYAQMFAFALLCFFFALPTIMLGFIPLMVSCNVSYQAYQAVLNGDIVDLPSAFIFVIFLAYALGSAVALLSLQAVSFCRCFMWGSLVKEVPADSEAEGEGIDSIMGD